MQNRQHHYKTMFATILLLLVILGVSWYAWKLRQNSVASTTLTKVTVRLAWLNQAQFAGMYVAKEKGFYHDAGLDVTLKEFEFDLDQSKEVAEEKVNFSVLSTVEMFKKISEGGDLKAVAAIYQNSPYAIASLKSKHIQTPADFAGKMLGLKGGNHQAKVTYNALLNEYGVDTKQVTEKELDYSIDESEDLLTGRADTVDLYRTDQTYLFDQKHMEYTLLFPEKFNFATYGDMLVTTGRMIREKPELVRAFVQATLKGWRYAIDHPEEAVRITMQVNNKDYNDVQRETYILQKSIPLIQPHGAEEVGTMQYIPFSKTYEAMRSAGLIATPFDVRDTYSVNFLN